MLFGNDITKIEKYAQKGKNVKIIPYLASDNRETRLAAIKVVDCCYKYEAAYNSLIAMLDCEDVEERVAIIEALSRSKNTAAITRLSQELAKEDNEVIIKAMREAIAKLRAETK